MIKWEKGINLRTLSGSSIINNFILINLRKNNGMHIVNVPLLSVASGVAISTYAKYCYRKLTKAALTGAKKVRGLTF